MHLVLPTFFLTLCFVISLSFAGQDFLTKSLRNESDIKIPKSMVKILVDKMRPALEEGYTTAQLNNYTDQILQNVRHYIVELGLDPMNLPDEKLSLFPGSITLTKGFLEDAASIGRYDDVMAMYSSDTKIFELTLPLMFNELLVNYKYHTQILILGITGQLDGKITKAKITIRLGFNFNTYEAFVNKADVRDTGSIHLDFQGHALTDWIINLMDGVITTLFRGLILDIVDLVIQSPINKVVKAFNTALASILHPGNCTMIL